MKLARFSANGQTYDGIYEDDQLRVDGVGTFDPKDVTWLPPIARYDKAIGLALNYADHAAELKLDLPPVPILFNKMPNTLIGHQAPIVAPLNIEYMHYENELVVVIARQCRKVKAVDANDVIFGYTIGNDVTIRDFVMNYYRPPVKAKGFDTFGPLGPYIVTADELPDVSNIGLRTYVNGELRQEGSTKDLIYSIPALIEYITDFMTLERFDMIWTGTPKGISPILPGDHLRLEIDGIGALENTVVAQSQDS